jgi:hypothetical protein
MTPLFYRSRISKAKTLRIMATPGHPETTAIIEPISAIRPHCDWNHRKSLQWINENAPTAVPGVGALPLGTQIGLAYVGRDNSAMLGHLQYQFREIFRMFIFS